MSLQFNTSLTTSEDTFDISQICSNPLLGLKQAWESPFPHFGLCIERTLLVWIPCLLLCICSPVYVILLRRRSYDPIPRTHLFYIKMGVTTLFIFSSIAEMIWVGTRNTEKFPSLAILAPSLFIITQILHLYLVHLGRLRGERCSPLLWVFWGVVILCGIPQLLTTLYATTSKPKICPAAMLTTFMIQYLCSVVLFIAHSFMDQPTKTKSMEDRKNCSPELEASFLNRITFWWTFPLIYKGWKRVITEDDFWEVLPRYQIKTIYSFLQTFLGREPDADPSNLNQNQKSQVNDNEKRKPSKKDVSMFRIICSLSKYELGLGFICKVISTTALFLTPFFISKLIKFIADKEQAVWRGYLYASCLLLVCLIHNVIRNKMLYYEISLTIKVRSALMAAVYQKALKLSSAARRESTVGQIVNLMAVDAQAVGDVCVFICNLVTSPTVALIALILVWQKLGPSVLAGITLLLLMIPFNSYVSSKASAIHAKAMKHKDKRVKLISEIIGGMKVLKLYAWENYFVKEVEATRDKEIHLLKRAGILQSAITFIYQLVPNLVALVTFTTYLLVSEENVLDAEKAFVSISLFNIMRFPVNIMPMVINSCVQAKIALDRIQKFISSEEIDPSAVSYMTSQDADLCIKKGHFTWDEAEDGTAWNLKDIELTVTRGQLVAVVGTVGAGKSSLISSLLGEMTKKSGRVFVNGRIAYVSQQAWLQNATLRDNITWGMPFEEKRYQEIVSACALKQDLDILPDGDMTEIGERGINLSGGQKQRISLARAVYSASDIFLLDDPLSAVDAHVSRHIFDNVIGPNGMLKKKTRVLVTHALTYMTQVDHVIVMKEGQIVEQGCYSDLLAAENNFSQLIQQYTNNKDTDDTENEIISHKPADPYDKHHLLHLTQEKQISKSCDNVNWQRIYNSMQMSDSSSLLGSNTVNNKSGTQLRKRTISEQVSYSNFHLDHDFHNSVEILNRHDDDIYEEEAEPLYQKYKSQELNFNHKNSNGKDIEKEEAESKSKATRLVLEEGCETGKVYKEVYFIFAKAIGFMYIIVPIVIVTLAQISVAGGNLWLSLWSSSEMSKHENHTSHLEAEYNNGSEIDISRSTTVSANISSPNESETTFNRYVFLAGYGAFGFLQATFMVTGILTVTMGCLRASNRLHQSLMSKVVRLPMSFFDTNPSGRIINRFSKEIHVLDSILPGNLRGGVSYFTQVIVTITVIIITTPLAAVFLIPIMILYYLVQSLFVSAHRQMKRIESITKSPVYSHFSETVQGASIIRAFKKQNDFISESLQKIERSQTVVYLSISNSRWLGVHLDTLGNLITFAAAIVAVASRDTIDPGIVGMSVTYALYITIILNWCVRIASDIEANIVAVERINDYLKRDTEAEWETDGKQLSQKWPDKGQVSFSNYQTRYRPGLDLVLRGISCSFKAGEKVGIVGRTGAGKSSLTLALFRLIEATGGNITIDDVDISSIGLHDLRSQISIIPQDPVLFSGTLRLNLDPSEDCKDTEVWQALELAHLKDYVASLPLGLQHVVDEEGSNFSVGQKQLVCLARALLRRSRILVLDEATAAVDLETDDLIQTTIRSQFKDSTVLTIAHRLNTIMDSDRVMVLEHGNVVEFDAPSSLLNQSNSVFYGLAKEAGLA